MFDGNLPVGMTGTSGNLEALWHLAVAPFWPSPEPWFCWLQRRRRPPPTTDRHTPTITNIVVIYEENHSFDNLFGGWERVDGTRRVTQVGTDGAALPCLPQTDVNLTSPPKARDLLRNVGRNQHQVGVPEPPLRDRPIHQAGGHHLPAAGGIRPERRAQR